MPTNRIASALATIVAVIATVVLLAGCGGSSTATQSAGVSSLTTTSSVAPSTASSGTSTSASTTTSSATTSAAKTSGAQSTRSQGAKPTTSPKSSAAKSPPGKLAVASDAFPHSGKIPVRYTCDGSNTSPPLQWGKLPTGTSQLLVLALSLTPGAQGAIRWAVGGINPSSGGFAAGQLPPGAVAGRSSDGHVGWAGICPVGKKPQAIIMLVYALKHPLSLTSGFDPRTVQSQLRGNTLGSGIVYGAYKRP